MPAGPDDGGDEPVEQQPDLRDGPAHNGARPNVLTVYDGDFDDSETHRQQTRVELLTQPFEQFFSRYAQLPVEERGVEAYARLAAETEAFRIVGPPLSQSDPL